MENEKIIFPDGTIMDREECLDNLLNTRDFALYLDALYALREKYLIILSVKDTPGANIPDNCLKRVHKLGFTRFIKTVWWTYVGIVDRGNVVFDEHGSKREEPIHYENHVNGTDLNVTSKSFRNGNISEIIINGTNYSSNKRGINIVVYEYEKNEVIDSISYDGHAANPTFYHKNLEVSDTFLENHVFFPEKYFISCCEPFKKKYFSNLKLNTVEIDNGIILPNKYINNKWYGGVCDENFNFIAGHKTIEASGGYYSKHIFGSYRVSENEIDYIDEIVVYGGTFINHIGHLISESFANRIWWFVKNSKLNYKIAAPIFWGKSDARFVKEFLEVFGIDSDRLIPVEKATKFKKVIVPDECMVQLRTYFNYFYTIEARDVFKQVCSNVTPSNYKKIYFTKRKMTKGNIVGEDFFINFFENKNFKIIDPEEYSLKEKISFVLGAEEFVTTAGTNALYAVFCMPSASVTILSRSNNDTHSYQAPIYEIARVKNFYYVNVSIGFLHKSYVEGLCFLGVTDEFREYVKTVYNEVLNITQEEYLKNHLYEYMQNFSDFYSGVKFSYIKNQKMLTVLQNMSEIFLGKDFDTVGIDITTNEDSLEKQTKQLALDLDASKTQKDELSKENAELAKSVMFSRRALEIQERESKLIEERLQNNLKIAEESNRRLLAQIDSIKSESLAQIKKANAEKDKIALQNADLQKKVNEYRTSRSWRITKPLRSIAWFFRRLFGKAK